MNLNKEEKKILEEYLTICHIAHNRVQRFLLYKNICIICQSLW